MTGRLKPRDVPRLKRVMMDVALREVTDDAPRNDRVTALLWERAGCWWVSAEMVDLVQVASRSLAEDTCFEHLSLPASSGFVWLEKPLVVDDGAAAEGFLWLEGVDPQGGRKVGVVPFRDNPGRTIYFWPGSAAATIPTFFLLLAQELAEVSSLAPLPREVKKTRKSGSRPPQPVRVVRLRRPTRDASGGAGTSREWSHRWLVSGHWRDVAYGPGQSKRRRQYIAGFVKGPADKPFIPKDTVRVWDR